MMRKEESQSKEEENEKTPTPTMLSQSLFLPKVPEGGRHLLALRHSQTARRKQVRGPLDSECERCAAGHGLAQHMNPEHSHCR